MAATMPKKTIIGMAMAAAEGFTTVTDGPGGGGGSAVEFEPGSMVFGSSDAVDMMSVLARWHLWYEEVE